MYEKASDFSQTGYRKAGYASGMSVQVKSIRLITPQNFMVLLIRASNLSAGTDGNFSDVAPSAHYYEAVAVAKKLGITTGVGNNKFNPGAFIPRQGYECCEERIDHRNGFRSEWVYR